MSGFWKVCSLLCTQYLVWPPFAWITALMQRGMEAMSLWHAHLPLDNIPYILYVVQVRRVCWPIKHSNTMVIEPAFGIFGSVGRCQVLLENEISISIKLVSRRKHEVLYNVLVDGCVDCGLQKTQWTNTSRWHGSPNHHWLWTLHTGLQATWIQVQVQVELYCHSATCVDI